MFDVCVLKRPRRGIIDNYRKIKNIYIQGEKKMRKLLNKKGFTLAELLIVVAIIAVLVAIAIPIFTTQLEKSKESTDAANLRAAYATAAAAVLDSQTGVAAGPVEMRQGTAGFAYVTEKIGTVDASSLTDAKVGVSYYVNVGTDGTMSITTNAKEGYTKINPVTGSHS